MVVCPIQSFQVSFLNNFELFNVTTRPLIDATSEGTTTRKTSSYKEVVTATIKTNTSNETFFSTKPVVGTTTYTLSSLCKLDIFVDGNSTLLTTSIGISSIYHGYKPNNLVTDLTSKDGTSPTISFTDVPIINTTIHTEVVPISSKYFL